MKTVARATYEPPTLKPIGRLACHLPGDAAHFRQAFSQLPVIREKNLDRRVAAHRRRRLLGRPRGNLAWCILRRWRLLWPRVPAATAAVAVMMMLVTGCGSVDVAKGGADADADRSAGDVDAVSSRDGAPDAQLPAEVGGGSVDAARDAGGPTGDAGPSCSWTCRSFCYCGELPCCRSNTSSDCCSS